MNKLMTLIAASMAVAGFYTPASFAQSANTVPPADLHPPARLDADALRAQFTNSQLGLRPQAPAKSSATELPFGLNYNRDAKSLAMPLDEKNEWGIGIGLNINSANPVGLTPSNGNTFEVQPKRAPGLMLHRKF